MHACSSAPFAARLERVYAKDLHDFRFMRERAAAVRVYNKVLPMQHHALANAPPARIDGPHDAVFTPVQYCGREVEPGTPADLQNGVFMFVSLLLMVTVGSDENRSTPARM